MGKKKQSFLGFTVKRAIWHWATKILVVHPYISEIDSTAAFQLLVHSQAMIMPGVLTLQCCKLTWAAITHLLPDAAGLKITLACILYANWCLKYRYFSVFVEVCTAFPQARSLNTAPKCCSVAVAVV